MISLQPMILATNNCLQNLVSVRDTVFYVLFTGRFNTVGITGYNKIADRQYLVLVVSLALLYSDPQFECFQRVVKLVVSSLKVHLLLS